MNIPIAYEDDWLLIADKPTGLLTIPTPKKESRTLVSILNDDLKKKGSTYRLHPCHRLDRETSGLIVFAKGKSVQKKMMGLFRERRVKKTYVAFIRGDDLPSEGEIKKAIEGKPALTRYKLIEKRKDFSVAEVLPLTGRTNQIRIHFKEIGHPLLGETRFAFRRDFKVRVKRLMLHAENLEFVHPVTMNTVSVNSKLPQDMRQLLDRRAQ